MKLFDTEEHEGLTSKLWDNAESLSVIRSIVDETENHFSADSFWPEHPEDQDWSPGVPMTSLYWGASSVIWALHHLHDQGVVRLKRDYSSDLEPLYQTYLRTPDSDEVAPGYLFGEAGIAFVGYKLNRSPLWEERVYQAVLKTILRPEMELMWAAPGAVLVAKKMHDWTQEARWKNLCRQAVDHLFNSWNWDESAGAWIWTQSLYGKVRQHLGAVHGLAGNLFSLLASSSLLDEKEQKLLFDRASQSIQKTAVRTPDGLNWPYSLDRPNGMLVQFCHGAPGVILSMGPFPKNGDAVLESDLLTAGELTWRAGPLRNSFGLCHGNPGNSYAFLKLYSRTGDPKWLERAKAFAAHAIQQSDREHKRNGRRRFSLLTGDLGLALNLWACLNEKSDFPLYELL